MDRALARLVAIGIAAVSAIVVADAQVVLYEHSLAPYGSTSLASPLSRAGDVDADGVEDYAIGDTNNASHGAAAGRVAVFSGRTGAQIREFFGAAHDQFGTSIASVGDLDADGHADLVVGAPEVSSTGADGYVEVLSPHTGNVLLHVDAPASQLPGTYLGRAVAGLGDVDLDGVPDFAASAGAWSFCPARQVFVFSGATGAVVWQITGLCGLGVSLARIGDLDGDQADELIAGDVYALNAYGHYAGAVNVYSGATGVLLRHFETDDPHIGFGESVCAVQDIDHDGFDEIAVGCPGDSAYVTHGRIEVFSGGSGAQMLVIDEPYQSTAQLLGRYVDTVEDIDGDGSRDLLSGVVRGDVSHARLYSSRTGALVVEGFHMPGLYSSVASLGDLNGDGTAEIACRAWSYDAGTWHDTVEISLFGVAVPETYCTAKVNSLGCTPEIGSSGAASLAVGDNFVVGASNVLNAKPGVLLWGASPLSTPFAGGTLCVAPTPPSIRGPLLDSGGSPPSASDCTGSYSFHFSHALMQSRGLTAGTQLYAQFLSRDPGFAPPRNVGLTDALSFTVIP